ncbi:MAG: glycosyltransferase family 4 protein [Candidatus Margulisiibacteriota bacterium]|nr:glycosyltransferase family 4 protein [Candidatus Margulisiibacteriota bacterium]
MKIAMLHWGFPPVIGGVETHLIFLMPELCKMGHEVFLLTGSAEGSPDEFEFQGAKITRSPYFELNSIFKGDMQETDGEAKKAICGFLDKSKPDVIHAHNMHYFCRYHTWIVENYALEHKIPLVLTAHNSWTDKLFLDLTCKVAWDKIIAISRYIKREIMSVGFPEKKIEVIYHGIDSDLFCPGKPSRKLFKYHPQLKGRKHVVFNPARMGLVKGCDITIEAFALVKKELPDAFLIMSGSSNIIDLGQQQGKDISYFRGLIKQLEIEDSVYINTFSIDKEMPDLYRMADVVIYPSIFEEPFGLAMLESMAAAKPIVVTSVGGMPEVIHDDVNGYVVPRRNHVLLAEKIIKLLKDNELRGQLGRTGRQQVEGLYTKEIYARKIIKVFEDAIKDYFPKPLKYSNPR